MRGLLLTKRKVDLETFCLDGFVESFVDDHFNVNTAIQGATL
jgi:hypothetical protein